MKISLLKKFISAGAAFAISFCCINFNTAFAENEIYTLSFDLEGATSETEFKTISVKGGTSICIPEGEPEKEGFRFSGWTCNNYLLYEGNDAFLMPDEDTVLVPVWVDEENRVYHDISYDDEGCDFVGTLEGDLGFEGDKFVITNDIVLKDGYYHLGWTDGEHTFQKGQKMIVPDHDVVLSPIWFQIHNIYYETGDVDNLIGGSNISFEKPAEQSFELSDSTRFARLGYSLVGWLCDVDGQTYNTSATFVMPDSDVHFTAVWKPLKYKIKFFSSASSYFTVDASYGDTITMPECEFKKSGYVFDGWDYEGTIYQPGESFEIPALLKGKSIVIGCKWVKETEQPTTNTSPQVTLRGDANEDGQVTIADAVAIAAFVGNSNKNPLSEQGKINADVHESGNGLNASDALAIQQSIIGIINL